MVSMNFNDWMVSFFIVSVYSILYKETKLYRFTESTYVGVSVAHYMILAWNNLNNNAIKGITQKGEILWVVPIILAFMMGLRLVSQYRWASRWPMAILLGVGMGTTVRGIIKSQIVDQISGVIKFATVANPTTYNIFFNAVSIVSTILAVSYFFFFVPRKGAFGTVSKLGRVVLMIGFGTALAFVFQQRSMITVYEIVHVLQVTLGII